MTLTLDFRRKITLWISWELLILSILEKKLLALPVFQVLWMVCQTFNKSLPNDKTIDTNKQMKNRFLPSLIKPRRFLNAPCIYRAWFLDSTFQHCLHWFGHCNLCIHKHKKRHKAILYSDAVLKFSSLQTKRQKQLAALLPQNARLKKRIASHHTKVHWKLESVLKKGQAQSIVKRYLIHWLF